MIPRVEEEEGTLSLSMCLVAGVAREGKEEEEEVRQAR